MQIIRKVRPEEVEAAFLRTEWYKERYNPIRSQYDKIVNDRDFTNVENNRKRRELLWEHRKVLLEQLPIDTQWYEIELTEDEFENIRIIKGYEWEKTFGTARKVKSVVNALMNNIRSKEIDYMLITGIKNNIGTYPFNEKIILVSDSLHHPYSILEGNHRALAFALRALELNDRSHVPKRFFLGVSKNMIFFPWMNQ